MSLHNRHLTASPKSLLYKGEKSEVVLLVAEMTWAQMGTFAQVIFNSLMLPWYPAATLHVCLFLPRLNGDSYMGRTRKHVDINERLLPKRKHMRGLTWAALAQCAAL